MIGIKYCWWGYGQLRIAPIIVTAAASVPFSKDDYYAFCIKYSDICLMDHSDNFEKLAPGANESSTPRSLSVLFNTSEYWYYYFKFWHVYFNGSVAFIDLRQFTKVYQILAHFQDLQYHLFVTEVQLTLKIAHLQMYGISKICASSFCT